MELPPFVPWLTRFAAQEGSPFRDVARFALENEWGSSWEFPKCFIRMCGGADEYGRRSPVTSPALREALTEAYHKHVEERDRIQRDLALSATPKKKGRPYKVWVYAAPKKAAPKRARAEKRSVRKQIQATPTVTRPLHEYYTSSGIFQAAPISESLPWDLYREVNIFTPEFEDTLCIPQTTHRKRYGYWFAL